MLSGASRDCALRATAGRKKQDYARIWVSTGRMRVFPDNAGSRSRSALSPFPRVFSSLPVNAMVAAMNQAEIPAAVFVYRGHVRATTSCTRSFTLWP